MDARITAVTQAPLDVDLYIWEESSQTITYIKLALQIQKKNGTI